jgi:hypothetical protein
MTASPRMSVTVTIAFSGTGAPSLVGWVIYGATARDG